MPSNTTTHKRKRSNGSAMPHLREIIDEETGEVYHVETTKEAKRRHRRNAGAQYQPTIGQMNAADIWNRQEAKIKRDKERVEKKKKAKARDEAREARLKELQQEDLRKGRISIEDTWGRVNASQNRLHRFFGPPLRQNNTELPPIEDKEEPDLDINHKIELDTNGNVEEDTDEVAPGQEISAQELQDIFATSPLSPDVKPQANAFLEPESTALKKPSPPCAAQTSKKRKSSQTSQQSDLMMPPPKRYLQSPSSSERARKTTGGEKPICHERSYSVQQPPLADTTYQLNVRSTEKPETPFTSKRQDLCLQTASQVIRDTLLGLCSQDLLDDFLDSNKENRSSSRSSRSLRTKEGTEMKGGDCKRASFHDLLDELSDSECCKILDGFETESFDDDGLDDESLLALAATQQLKNELFTSSKLNTNIGKSMTASESNVSGDTSFSRKQNCATEHIPKPGDSFAMDGLNDEDLLEGLQNFENAANPHCFSNSHQHQEVQQLTKMRRTLPWVKYPIVHSQGKQDHPDESTSPEP